VGLGGVVSPLPSRCGYWGFLVVLSFFLACVARLAVVVGFRLFGAPFCCFLWCLGSVLGSFGCAFGSVCGAGGGYLGGVL